MSDVLTEFAAFLHPRAAGRLQGSAKLVRAMREFG
jgi:hypothetical protein